MNRRELLLQATGAALCFHGLNLSGPGNVAYGAEVPPLLDALLPDLPRPAEGDDTPAALREYCTAIEARYGGYRGVPLEIKAAYFEWQLFRYHLTDYHQVYNQVVLAEQAGVRPQPWPASDTSTWNGALLAALSYQYAVTREPRTLAQISTLIHGLHLFFLATGDPGLMARTMIPADGNVLPEMRDKPFLAPDGRRYFLLRNPAKGTYNQIAMGYGAMLLHAFHDLPPDVQELARLDVTYMVIHLLNHDYRATDHGRPTSSGDIRPLIGTTGVPFNAQVAYQIIALGHYFPPTDPARRARIDAEWRRLRHKHHVYYEKPGRSIIQPQRIAASNLIKGMNDRNHVVNAAFIALAIELEQARRHQQPFDALFVHQLGQTLVHGLAYLYGERNSLCNFMLAGMLGDAQVFQTIYSHVDRPERIERVHGQINRGLLDGVEQLRRFRLDRFSYPGEDVETKVLQWCDAARPDDYYWKVNPRMRFEQQGAARPRVYCAIDFLHAYWLFRLYRLEERPIIAQQKLSVLVQSATGQDPAISSSVP